MALTNRDYVAFLNGTVLGTVQVKNVFYYKSDAAGEHASKLADGMILDLLPSLQALATTDMVYTSIEVINLDDLSDFYSVGFTMAGTIVAQTMPPFNAWAFRYQRPTRAVRHGWKRFSGVSETSQENGVASSGFLTTLGSAASALSAPLEYSGSVFDPCIAKTIEVPQSSDPTKTKYVPDTLYVCTDVDYIRLTSQVSRKL